MYKVFVLCSANGMADAFKRFFNSRFLACRTKSCLSAFRRNSVCKDVFYCRIQFFKTKGVFRAYFKNGVDFRVDFCYWRKRRFSFRLVAFVPYKNDRLRTFGKKRRVVLRKTC